METKVYSVKTVQDIGDVICFNGVPISFDLTIDLLNKYNSALTSISKNTCCQGCGEAKKVAKKALGDHLSKIIDEIPTRNAAGNLLL